MSEADRIRKYAYEKFIKPAKDKGLTEVAVAAKDVHDRLGLKSRFPNVCQALYGDKFCEIYGLNRPKVVGPNPSSTTIFIFRL